MATALRLTGGPPGQCTLAASGAFGRRVAAFMPCRAAAARLADERDLEDVFTSATGTVVVALWRPDRALCARADELAFSHQRSWLPIIMEHPVIRVGPLVTPPAGPCVQCSYRRQAQHDGHELASAALHAAYAADGALGPTGYLPHHARMAAAVAVDMLRQRSQDCPTEGLATAAAHVVTIRLTRLGLSVNRVVPCYNCPLCNVSQTPDSTRLGPLVASLQAVAGKT